MTASAPRLPVTVVIPTLDESRNIADAIRSVAWAHEVIVADGGSSDATVEVARESGGIVIERAGPTIGAQRNAAIERASHDWILALDADERATPALRDQLAGVLAAPSFDAYRVRRANSYLGAVMRHGRFARDWHLCVFRRTFRYNTARVHEGLVGVHAAGRLAGPLEHTPYRNLRHHAAKIVRYAEWAARDRVERGERTSAGALVLKPPLRFLRDYVAYGGWLDGWRGVVAATMSGYSVFLRAALLRDAQRVARTR